jgi:hypothetical protein
VRLGVVRRRALARGEKTAEDQGVPWRRTRVWCGAEVASGIVGDEERRVYFIAQLAWWKVCGRSMGVGVGRGISGGGGGV